MVTDTDSAFSVGTAMMSTTSCPWEIVESALDSDKRLFGEEIARARLRRLAAPACLPVRTDGLRPTTQPSQEVHP